MTTEKKKKFIINFAFAACVLIIIYFCFKYLISLLIPFVVAFIIAFLLQRPVNFILRKTKLKRKIVSPIVATIMVFIVGMLLFVAVNGIVREFIGFVTQLPTWYQNSAPVVLEAFSRIIDGLTASLPAEWELEIISIIDDLFKSIQTALVDLSTKAVSWIASRAGSVPSALVSVVISIIAIYFISGDFENIKMFISSHIPVKHKNTVAQMRSVFRETVVNMIKGYMVIMLITFFELSVGLTILRVESSILLAALIAVVDILPVLGTGTVLIPWSIISLITGDTFRGIGLIVIYVIILVVRNIIEPRFIGKRIGLSPLVTLICMYLGLKLAGVVGMLLLPLAMAFLKNIYDAGVLNIWKAREKTPEQGGA